MSVGRKYFFFFFFSISLFFSRKGSKGCGTQNTGVLMQAELVSEVWNIQYFLEERNWESWRVLHFRKVGFDNLERARMILFWKCILATGNSEGVGLRIKR